jgi:hypothetical protein
VFVIVPWHHVLMFLLFPPLERMQIEDYGEELEEMKNMTRQEYVAHLRR